MKPGAGGHEQEVALLGGQQDIGGVDSESCGDLLDHDPQRKTEILTHPARKRDTFYHRKTLSLILDGRVEASVLEQQRHVVGNQLHRIHVRLGQGGLLTPIESSECPDRRAAHAHRDDKESDGRHRDRRRVAHEVVLSCRRQDGNELVEWHTRDQKRAGRLDHPLRHCERGRAGGAGQRADKLIHVGGHRPV